jgi:hypothetical protein
MAAKPLDTNLSVEQSAYLVLTAAGWDRAGRFHLESCRFGGFVTCSEGKAKSSARIAD